MISNGQNIFIKHTTYNNTYMYITMTNIRLYINDYKVSTDGTEQLNTQTFSRMQLTRSHARVTHVTGLTMWDQSNASNTNIG